MNEGGKAHGPSRYSRLSRGQWAALRRSPLNAAFPPAAVQLAARASVGAPARWVLQSWRTSQNSIQDLHPKTVQSGGGYVGQSRAVQGGGTYRCTIAGGSRIWGFRGNERDCGLMMAASSNTLFEISDGRNFRS
jgi:hypothetical protein